MTEQWLQQQCEKKHKKEPDIEQVIMQINFFRIG